MTETLFVAKAESNTNSTSDLIKIFKSNTDLETIRNAVEKAEDRIFVAWSTVDDVDKSGERIPVEDIIRDMDNYMQMPSINDEHTNGVVGKCLAYKVMIHPVAKKLGVLQLNQILKRNPRDDHVWNDLQSGKKTGLSVGGLTGQKPEFESKADGSFVKVLAGFQQYETSVVENPCNQHALNEAVSTVAKSHTEEKMTEEETKKTEEVVDKVEETTKQEDESDEMQEQAPEGVSMDDMIAMIQNLNSRLDEVEAAMAGKPDQEDKAEDEEEMEDKEEKAEDMKEEEEEKEKEKSDSDEVTKLKEELSEVKKANAEMEEQLKGAQVIKAERPVENTKKKTLTALDVARGKARVIDGEVVGM